VDQIARQRFFAAMAGQMTDSDQTGKLAILEANAEP
jgi:hypothetical protein